MGNQTGCNCDWSIRLFIRARQFVRWMMTCWFALLLINAPVRVSHCHLHGHVEQPDARATATHDHAFHSHCDHGHQHQRHSHHRHSHHHNEPRHANGESHSLSADLFQLSLSCHQHVWFLGIELDLPAGEHRGPSHEYDENLSDVIVATVVLRSLDISPRPLQYEWPSRDWADGCPGVPVEVLHFSGAPTSRLCDAARHAQTGVLLA